MLLDKQYIMSFRVVIENVSYINDTNYRQRIMTWFMSFCHLIRHYTDRSTLVTFVIWLDSFLPLDQIIFGDLTW